MIARAARAGAKVPAGAVARILRAAQAARAVSTAGKARAAGTARGEAAEAVAAAAAADVVGSRNCGRQEAGARIARAASAVQLRWLR
jgi:hypothetical protein